jgi:thiol:disulfide interchange protein DsbC
MKKTIASCLLVLSAFLAGATNADEASVRQAFQAKVKASVESVTRSSLPGIYEVIAEGQVFYTDEKVTYIFRGMLLDMRGKEPRDIAEEATSRLMATTLSKSTDLAFKRVKGNGKRGIYTFEDPNCGYCKLLQKEFVKMNDVTIYTFLLPILSADSMEKSKAIWCSKDRAKAWDDFMLKGVAPTGRRDCDTSAIEKNRELAQRFRLRGTPAVYLANGEQIGGMVPAEKLEAALAAVR